MSAGRAPGPSCKPGMIFTIEPMINIGRPDVKLLDDGWTAVTRDRSLSAQFEHSIGITEDGLRDLHARARPGWTSRPTPDHRPRPPSEEFRVMRMSLVPSLAALLFCTAPAFAALAGGRNRADLYDAGQPRRQGVAPSRSPTH